MALAAEGKAALIDLRHDVEVHVNGALLRVETRAPLEEQDKLQRDMEKIVMSFPGVKGMDIRDVQRVNPSEGRLFPW